MASTALSVVLNSILLAQSLQTAHVDKQAESGTLKPQVT